MELMCEAVLTRSRLVQQKVRHIIDDLLASARRHVAHLAEARRVRTRFHQRRAPALPEL